MCHRLNTSRSACESEQVSESLSSPEELHVFVCVCVSSLKMYSHLWKCRALHLERVFLSVSGSAIVRMGTLYCVRHRMISLCLNCTLQIVSFWFWPIFDTFSRAFIQSDMHDTERFV